MDSCSCAGRDRIWGSGNQRTLPSELALREGPRRCWDTVAIVWPCLLGVDAYAAACRGCRVSHALLPAFVLARRLDAVAAIGAGLAWAVGGRGMRPIAAALGV